ncbi:hypothetical protein DXG01_016574, partial [Tephrocybe rancida]
MSGSSAHKLPLASRFLLEVLLTSCHWPLDSCWKFCSQAATGLSIPATYAEVIAELPAHSTNKNPMMILSPNAYWVPKVYLWKREVFVRRDGRFGYNDRTLWPQYYSLSFEYLACIPWKPKDANDPRAILWWNPHFGELLLVQNSSVDLDLVMVPQDRLASLKIWWDKLVKDVDDYQTSHMRSHFLRVLTTSMQHVFLRLSMAMTRDKMTEHVPEFQQFCLDIIAWLSYVLEFTPRLADPENVWRTRPVHHDLMGAVTEDIAIVQQLHQIKIPVWRVVPAAKLLNTINIFSVVSLSAPCDMEEWPLYTPPRVLNADAPVNAKDQGLSLLKMLSSSNTITDNHQSSSSGPIAVDRAVCQVQASDGAVTINNQSNTPAPAPMNRAVSQVVLAGPTWPTQAAVNPTGTIEQQMQVSKSLHTRTKQSHHRPVVLDSKAVPSSGQDTFKDVEWAMALTAVDRTPKPMSTAFLGYAFPDPNLFAGSESCCDEMLVMWLSRRKAMYWFELSWNMLLGSRAPAQSWKAFLIK